MEQVLVYKGLKLIKKYDHYYIRFIGGQREEIPCDLCISNKEAMAIVADPQEIKNVRDAYKKKVEWTQTYFIDSALKDYLFYECNMSEKRISLNLQKLNRHEDIKLELYETIIYGSFPKTGAIEVCSYTAEKLNGTTHLSILGAYNYLIYLREDEKNALDDLKKGLPIR